MNITEQRLIEIAHAKKADALTLAKEYRLSGVLEEAVSYYETMIDKDFWIDLDGSERHDYLYRAYCNIKKASDDKFEEGSHIVSVYISGPMSQLKHTIKKAQLPIVVKRDNNYCHFHAKTKISGNDAEALKAIIKGFIDYFGVD